MVVGVVTVSSSDHSESQSLCVVPHDSDLSGGVSVLVVAAAATRRSLGSSDQVRHDDSGRPKRKSCRLLLNIIISLP